MNAIKIKNTNQLAIIQQLIRQSENETTFQLKNMSLHYHDILYLTEAIPKYDHIYFTGVGKSDTLCQHVVCLLKSIGIKAFHLNIVNSLHGDIGTIGKNDAVIFLSKSGNTEEIISKITHIQQKKCFCISITNHADCKLKDICNKHISLPFQNELHIFNSHVPTNSCISFMLFFNIVVSMLSANIRSEDYAINHYHGSIGSSLKKIGDHLTHDFPKLVYSENIYVRDVCLEMTKYSIGCLFFLNDKDELIGIISDGDIRRLLIHNERLHIIHKEHMNTQYYYETDVNKFIKDCNINLKYIPVLENNKLIGIIDCLQSLQ
jgi:arabinose-5-phosphate isomerase